LRHNSHGLLAVLLRIDFGEGQVLVAEDHLRRLKPVSPFAILLAADGAFISLKVDEACKDVEHRIPLPLPQIRGFVAVRIVRVACSGPVAEIKGKEVCFVPVELGRHVDQIRIHLEVHKRPGLEQKELFASVAVGTGAWHVQRSDPSSGSSTLPSRTESH
jgi:hypothetical protein